MSKVTIGDIARKAGVSKTAVSFSFNNPSRLSESTVQRILAIADELGYSPDPIARSMNTRRTGTIGMLVPQSIPKVFRNPFIPELLEGVGEVCTKAGLSLMIVPPMKGSLKRAIENAAVDGFITLGLEEYKETMVVLKQRGIPYVTVDSDPIHSIPAVNVDDESGARAIMDHVLGYGHREITIFAIRSGKRGRYQEYAGTLHARMTGYLKAMEDYGLELDHRKIKLIECVCTEDGGRLGFQHVWGLIHKPTAIVSMSDIIALGALSAARDANVRVPSDVSIVGYDDIPYAAMVDPQLTTVAQPRYQKGKIAAELLLKYIDGKLDPVHHVLPTKLIVRNSVSGPRATEGE